MSATFDVFKGGPSFEVKACDGLYLYSSTGEKLLDMSGGSTSVMILGWNHPKINEAIISQLSRFSHVDYKAWRDPNVISLTDELIQNSTSSLDCVYFSGNSGAEACETAMKMSFLVNQAQGFKTKTKFIGRLQSYHGSTADTLSLTDRPNLLVHHPFFPRNKILIDEHNYHRAKRESESEIEYLSRSLLDLENTILEHGAENISGFIGETIMGGLVGDVPPVKGYWQGVRSICDKYNIHLIMDEVYCGTGTSGKYHCFEYDDVEPDFLTLAKTLAAGYAPLSAVLTHKKYQDIIYDGFNGRLAHSTTMQAYSLGVAAALEVQRIVGDSEFQLEVFRKGEKFRQTIHEELIDNPFYKNCRGRGLRFSVEHNCKDNVRFSQKISQFMRNKGIHIDSKWHKTGFTPSLTISDKQIEYVVDNFIEVFKGI